LTRSNTVDRRGLNAGGDLVLQTHDSHLEELVDHVGKDGDEFASLENGDALIAAEIQQSCAELKP
jgi:hypothetical protein